MIHRTAEFLLYLCPSRRFMKGFPIARNEAIDDGGPDRTLDIGQ